MAVKHIATINGSKYEISTSDFNTLNRIISRSTLIAKGNENIPAKATPVTTPAAPNPATPATTSTLQGVMGVHYKECVIYDCENNKLLTQTYNGIDVYWDAEDTKNAKTFKEWFDKEFKKENLTLVCSVSKQVLKKDYPGWGQWTQSGQQIRMNRAGSYTVCNFIVRDETTGKLEMFNNSAWLGVWDQVDPFNAARYGAYRVADRGARDSDFRSAVRAGYQRNKTATR